MKVTAIIIIIIIIIIITSWRHNCQAQELSALSKRVCDTPLPKF